MPNPSHDAQLDKPKSPNRPNLNSGCLGPTNYHHLETLAKDLIDSFGQDVDGDAPIVGSDAVDSISENLEVYRRALYRQ